MVGFISPPLMYGFAGVLFFLSMLFMVSVKKFIGLQNWPDAILAGIISVLVMVLAATVLIGSYVLFTTQRLCGL